MYRVVLVDDEPWALIGIRKTFQWKDMGFEVVHEDADPLTAFEFIRNHKPDVVVTDIRMPGISGIELMQKARAAGLKSEFVIISGAADFGFAREAIRLGCFDYLLKPLQYEDADAVLKRLSEHLKLHSGAGQEKRQSTPLHLDPNLNENFKDLLHYVHNHLDEELQLKELAGRFYINYTYCCDLFRKVTDITFSEYVTQLRISRACDLLINSRLSIAEVSRSVGYHDYNYFIKVFKKHSGVTPSSYRKQRAEGVSGAIPCYGYPNSN